MITIDMFIDSLASYRKAHIFNPWAESCRLDRSRDNFLSRREHLRLHLSCDNPLFAIVGEAPGWRGARFSGVPFTSEGLLCDHAVPRVGLAEGERITTGESPLKEPSATMVWQEIYRHQVADRVVMFNGVPWHPEGKDSPLSNRAPNEAELNAGLERLALFFEIFTDIPVLALGMTAARNLSRLNVAHTKIRHPANGGAPLFRSGFEVFVKRLLN